MNLGQVFSVSGRENKYQKNRVSGWPQNTWTRPEYLLYIIQYIKYINIYDISVYMYDIFIYHLKNFDLHVILQSYFYKYDFYLVLHNYNKNLLG